EAVDSQEAQRVRQGRQERRLCVKQTLDRREAVPEREETNSRNGQEKAAGHRSELRAPACRVRENVVGNIQRRPQVVLPCVEARVAEDDGQCVQRYRRGRTRTSPPKQDRGRNR